MARDAMTPKEFIEKWNREIPPQALLDFMHVIEQLEAAHYYEICEMGEYS